MLSPRREDKSASNDGFWVICANGKLSAKLFHLSTGCQRVSIATEVSSGAIEMFCRTKRLQSTLKKMVANMSL